MGVISLVMDGVAFLRLCSGGMGWRIRSRPSAAAVGGAWKGDAPWGVGGMGLGSEPKRCYRTQIVARGEELALPRKTSTGHRPGERLAGTRRLN